MSSIEIKETDLKIMDQDGKHLREICDWITQYNPNNFVSICFFQPRNATIFADFEDETVRDLFLEKWIRPNLIKKFKP